MNNPSPANVFLDDSSEPIRAYHVILKDNGWLSVWRDEGDKLPVCYPEHRIRQVNRIKERDNNE